MLEPKIVRQIEELSAQGWGSRRIANELGVARNTVRRYLRGGEAAQQQVRPRARRLDAAARRKAIVLFEGAAEGNAVVVRELLAAQGLRVSLRTIQRVVEERLHLVDALKRHPEVRDEDPPTSTTRSSSSFYSGSSPRGAGS